MRQEYHTNLLFPVRCFSFKSSQKLLKDTYAKVQDLEYRNYNAASGVGTTDQLHDRKDFYDLHQWFQDCIDTLHADNSWTCDRIIINKSWANRSDASSGHHHSPHRHPMSFLSAIYYITEGVPTVFIDPLQQREWAQLHVDGGPIEDATQYVHPKPGGLFIFPSYMIHSSDPNYESKDRFTISFNTFPSGHVNAGGWDRPMIDIHTNGWKDLGPLELSKYLK